MKHNHDNAEDPQIAHKQPRRKWEKTVKIEQVEKVCELYKATQTTISQRAIAKRLGTTHATLVSDPAAAALVNRYIDEQNKPAPIAKLKCTEPPITITWQPATWTAKEGAKTEQLERWRKRLSYRPMVGEE